MLILSFGLLVCADVAPRGREVELQRVSSHQDPGRPSQGGPWVGERRRREDVRARPAEEERVVRRHRFDDPGAGPSHALSVDAVADFADILHHLEAVLQGMWSCIQDEGILEQCVGVPPPWRAMVRRATIAGVAMSRRLPLGPEGPVVGGGPPPKGGAGGGALEAP
jgi:hypothetical protein